KPGLLQISENSVLSGLTAGELRLDCLRLPVAPPVSAVALPARIRHWGPSITSIDRVRLAVVEHDPALRAYWSAGHVVVGSRVAALQATVNGQDVLASIDG